MATLSFWGITGGDNSEIDFYITIQSGQPSYPHDPLRLEDYSRFHYSGNGGSFFTGDIDPYTWDQRYWNISLNSDGISMINKGGQTKLCLRSSRDIDGISPTPAMERVHIRSANYHPTLYKPLLTVTYERVPYIVGISRSPFSPGYDESVTVTATITDNTAVDEALLSYTCDSVWHNVTMNKSGDIFNATIPQQSYGTLVEYKIYANDTDGNWAVSDLFSYTVVDDVNPKIIASQSPMQPYSGQKVKVLADVIEPVNASGVNNVAFYYRVNNDPWWSTMMVFNSTSNLWETTIPGQELLDKVEYYIRAQDNAGNENITETYSYIVAFTPGDVNKDGVVDIVDYSGLSAHWYPGPPIGPSGYDPDFDIDGDASIDVIDLAIISAYWTGPPKGPLAP